MSSSIIIACVQLSASRGYSLRSGNFCPLLAVVSASRTYTYEKETLRNASTGRHGQD